MARLIEVYVEEAESKIIGVARKVLNSSSFF